MNSVIAVDEMDFTAFIRPLNHLLREATDEDRRFADVTVDTGQPSTSSSYSPTTSMPWKRISAALSSSFCRVSDSTRTDPGRERTTTQ